MFLFWSLIPGFLTTPLKARACAGEQGSRGAGESSNTKFFPLCPSAPLPLCSIKRLKLVRNAGYRGQGLGKWFIEYILEYPELQNVQRWMLGTKDAHGLYRRYGFKNLTEPEKIMIRLNHNCDRA
ncbi:MAG: GNAT family N-acetyltransferase [Nostoc sp.]|uniref:GNAT family N-acetyltransferase n=1 Tax=Nostoc sp. TaxID=1180 RepID=UPI002FFC6816